MKIEPRMFDKVKDRALLDIMFKSAIKEANSVLEIKMLEAAYERALKRIKAKGEKK